MFKSRKRGDLILLVLSLFITLMVGFIGAKFTASSISDWYTTLIKPSFTPPSNWFAPVWTVLYVLMGISLFLIWRQNTDVYNVRQALKYFAIQLILNALWSFAFFYLQSPLLGVIVIVFLWLSIIATIMSSAKVSKWASILLYPYFIWVTFAAILNIAIWWLNI